MSIRMIARLGEPILRQKTRFVTSEELGSEELHILVEDLIDTMRNARGAGLAAPQIFDDRRVAVIEVKKNERYPSFGEIPLKVLINPVVTPLLGENVKFVKIYEGCLSIPNMRGQVTRPAFVHLSALDLQGNPLDEEWHGVNAAVLQHEVDHLDGTLFVDRVDPRTLTFLEELEQYVPPAQRVIL